MSIPIKKTIVREIADQFPANYQISTDYNIYAKETYLIYKTERVKLFGLIPLFKKTTKIGKILIGYKDDLKEERKDIVQCNDEKLLNILSDSLKSGMSSIELILSYQT